MRGARRRRAPGARGGSATASPRRADATPHRVHASGGDPTEDIAMRILFALLCIPALALAASPARERWLVTTDLWGNPS
jgi:hypothetical protein